MSGVATGCRRGTLDRRADSAYLNAMGLREILIIPDKRLRRRAAAVQRIDAQVRALAEDMLQTMYAAPGIGLAAPQIGVMRRLVVIDVTHARSPDNDTDGAEGGEDGHMPANSAAGERIDAADNGQGETVPNNPIVLINPQLLQVSAEMSVYQEGCLSIPEIYEDVERPRSCVVAYRDLEDRAQVLECEGVLATCVQHEIDHLDGKLFIDYLSRLKRSRIEKKFLKLARQERN